MIQPSRNCLDVIYWEQRYTEDGHLNYFITHNIQNVINFFIDVLITSHCINMQAIRLLSHQPGFSSQTIEQEEDKIRKNKDSNYKVVKACEITALYIL